MKKKMVSCKACGEEMSPKCKKCPKCGAKNKKPVYKKWWFWLIVVILLGSLGNGGSKTEAESITTTPPTTEAPTTVPTTEPTIETTEATTEATTEQETISGAEAAKLVMSIIELSIADTFDYHKIEGDETGITVTVATNGLVQDMTIAKYSGNGEINQDWVVAREALVSLSDTIYDSAVEFGMDDPVITLNVLNDQNHDNVILMVMNGIVVYDAMAD